MKSKKQYTVNVGNIGNIECANKSEAVKTFNEYVEQSKNNYGRAAGESVCIFEDGDIMYRYFYTGTIDQEEQ